MLSELPPVGQRLSLRTKNKSTEIRFSGFKQFWLQSGTAALALALMLVKSKFKQTSSTAEVILPAYGCPDLVAAVRFAKLTPILVDIQHDSPDYDLDALQQAVNENTVAIVGVTLLGARCNFARIQRLVSSNICLIEDNAQWFWQLNQPEAQLKNINFTQPYEFDNSFEHIDMTLTSFGKGKPVNLLGGGLLLVRSGWFNPNDRTFNIIKESTAQDKLLYQLKGSCFNRILSPVVYWLLTKLPIGIGETVYHSLEQIRRMDDTRRGYFAQNAKRFFQRNQSAQRIFYKYAKAHPLISPLSGFNMRHQQLRFPILCRNKSVRDNLLNRLSKAGLGASAMYKNSLINIAGIRDDVQTYSAAPNAQQFADRFITLPLHSGVKQAHVDRIIAIIQGLED